MNEKRAGVRGIEIRTRRYRAPGEGAGLLQKGSHVGSVEFGGDPAPALEDAKKVFNTEVVVLITQEAATQVWQEWQKNVKLIGNYTPSIPPTLP